MGSSAGWVLHGEPGDLVAAACAAALQRTPAIACVPAASATLTAELASWSCRLEREPAPDAASSLARRLGYRLMPGYDDPEFVVGMATLGVELAAPQPLAQLGCADGVCGGGADSAVFAAGSVRTLCSGARVPPVAERPQPSP